ncbi:hypothetical protein HK097_006394 [Rhizophlyctis rosea]|uniref:AA9 family lytic polysaccharide monooxygenase n=1 Tax=Rhizophlyctis rosea TaxID=64517 RepID=A0AAD5X917_9FUNG|nr:hypothetical protein HK097_006394 [Rhizophlyctis rosea]
MKAIFPTLLLAGAASAHTIFSEVAVNGVWQGKYTSATNGLRLPSYDGPVQDVTSNDVTCNGGVNPITYKSNYKIPVKAGDSISLRWTHTLTSTPQSDPEDPVADGHNGPIMVYMAKVGDAVTDTPRSGWFKIYEDGMSSDGTWAVQRLRANGGVVTVKIPECLAPGDYLFRGELIALHAAASYPGAQLYMECAQFTVTGSGSTVPSNTVSFPGAYSGSDPGIKLSIYYPKVTNYIIPGPRPFTCGNNGGGSNPTTTTTQPPRTTTTTRPPVTTTTTTQPPRTTTTTTQPPRTTTTTTRPPTTGGAPLYGQW